MSRLSAKKEHNLRAGIYFASNARCTVCIICGAMWWTPKPSDRESYVPRYCEGDTGPPLGVYILLNDADRRLLTAISTEQSAEKK